MLPSTISTELLIDTKGKIQRYTGLDSKKDGINLYLKIDNGVVPFWNFGNYLLLFIFHAETDRDIQDLVNELIEDIKSQFSIAITDYDVNVMENGIAIKLYLQYSESLDFLVNL